MSVGPSQGRHTAGGLVAVLLWSTSIAVVRSLSEQVGSLTAGSAVFAVGGVLGLGWTVRTRGSLTVVGGWRSARLVACGACFVFYAFALYEALGMAVDRRQVLEIALLNYLWPALTLLLAVVLLGRRARWLIVPGTLLALAGEVLALTQDAAVSWTAFAAHLRATPGPYALATLAALSWALYSNLTGRWAQGGWGAVPLFMLAAALVLAVLRLARPEVSHWGLRPALELAYLGTASAVSNASWEAAMRRGDVVLVAAASYFTPLLSALLTCAYLQVVPGSRLWVGCVALVAGSLLSWASVRRGEQDASR